MTVRERLEMAELQTLSPHAAKALYTKGRAAPLTQDTLRTSFQRDRDRIIHCKSFRRLKNKTQVFLSPQGDHYRTRLTHTLEVAQVARTIARALCLNEDLTEAIALGHDLGHTPFGHIGENTLNRLTPNGFAHNAQSLRVVERLERDGQGLNLCHEVRNGIYTHSGADEPQTLEGWCVRRADRVAYINHDIDDAIRGGVLQPFELPKQCLAILGDTHGRRIDTLIADIVKQSAPTFATDQPAICMSAEVLQASEELRDFLFARVYRDGWRKREEERCDYVLEALYRHYCRHPEQMPEEYQSILSEEGADRAVCDYIAGMTDHYAVSRFTELFVPRSFSEY